MDRLNSQLNELVQSRDGYHTDPWRHPDMPWRHRTVRGEWFYREAFPRRVVALFLRRHLDK
jgi:hypothetical protein